MLVLIGCSHRSAPIALRERLAFTEAELPQVLSRLLAEPGVLEGSLLSTCNRVELLARTDRSDSEGLATLNGFLVRERGVALDDLDRHAYRLSGRDAVQHVFEVAAGLQSMILGEPQILGQVKEAYRVAKGCGATGSVVERMLQQCLATAKRVRTRTGITRNPISVASAAVHLARKIFGDLKGRRALVLGAGKMAELVARHLRSAGVSEIIVASRTYDRSIATAQRVGGRPADWDEGLASLAGVDVVVSCTGSTVPVVTKEVVERASKARRRVPLFLIDIAVPRDVDPRVHELDNVYLYDIDGLQEVVDSNMEQRQVAAGQARREIVADTEVFWSWRQSLEVTPTIVELQDKLDDVARAEVHRFRKRLGPLSSDQQEAVEQLTRALMRKVLHRPILHLRRSANLGDADRCTSLYREIFGLETEPDSEPTEPNEEPRGPSRVLRGGKGR